MVGALAAEDDESYEYTLTIARLEHELSEIQQSVSSPIRIFRTTDAGRCRREALVSQLTKDRDALIKAKKEIKAKFDAVDVYLTDFAKVSLYIRLMCSRAPLIWVDDERRGE